jgi:hypothetical protein
MAVARGATLDQAEGVRTSASASHNSYRAREAEPGSPSKSVTTTLSISVILLTIKASGQTKKAYVAACRADTTGTPAGAPPPPATAAPAPAPIAPAPAPVAPRPQTVGATGAGQFATDTQARARCPSDTVVWVNTKSSIYHFAGKRDYGNTKQGAYMCEADAKAAGDRAAKNEKHP